MHASVKSDDCTTLAIERAGDDQHVTIDNGSNNNKNSIYLYSAISGIEILFRGAYYNIGISMKYNTMLTNNTMLKKYNVISHQIALWWCKGQTYNLR